jgi:hypothetical protein
MEFQIRSPKQWGSAATGRGDLRCDQVDEAGIGLVERPIRINRCDDMPAGLGRPCCTIGKTTAVCGGLSQVPFGSAGWRDRSSSTTCRSGQDGLCRPKRADSLEVDQVGCDRMAGGDAGTACRTCCVVADIEQVGRRERKIALSGLEATLAQSRARCLP